LFSNRASDEQWEELFDALLLVYDKHEEKVLKIFKEVEKCDI
jgi:hypothetical protein